MRCGEESAGAFVFDAETSRVVIGDEALLEGLRRYAAVVGGRPFRMKEFRAWKDRPFEPNTVRRRFGTWRKALARIGIAGARVSEYEPEELMANLEDVWRRHGRRPSFSHLQKLGRCGWQAYCRRWGSVKRACVLLAAHKRGEMTRAELLAAGPGKRARRKALSVDVRWKVMKRDRFRCRVCGKSPAVHKGVELEVDHIVSVARGGTDDLRNLRTLCLPCNRGEEGWGVKGEVGLMSCHGGRFLRSRCGRAVDWRALTCGGAASQRQARASQRRPPLYSLSMEPKDWIGRSTFVSLLVAGDRAIVRDFRFAGAARVLTGGLHGGGN